MFPCKRSDMTDYRRVYRERLIEYFLYIKILKARISSEVPVKAGKFAFNQTKPPEDCTNSQLTFKSIKNKKNILQTRWGRLQKDEGFPLVVFIWDFLWTLSEKLSRSGTRLTILFAESLPPRHIRKYEYGKGTLFNKICSFVG